MSAYIVNDDTINRILAGIEHARLYGNWQSQLPKPDPTLFSKAVFNSENTALLGEELRRMNAEAVHQRYPGDKLDQLPGPRGEDGKMPPYQYLSVLPPTAIQMVKSIDCYLYQCSEGNVPETWGLYRALNEYKRDICERIISLSKAYEKAQWD